MELIRIESRKTPKEIIKKIGDKAADFNFIIRKVFDMKEQFMKHLTEVEGDFEYYSIMVCNPKKAYQSIKASPIRGAILLPPKQIVIYKDPKTNHTIIAYMKLNKEAIAEMIPDDIPFQENLEQSCDNIIKLIRSIGGNNEI